MLREFASAVIDTIPLIALAILVFAVFEHFSEERLSEESLAGHKRWHLPAATFLAAIPGCGGIIQVAKFYLARMFSLPVLAAASVATMGDSGLILWAKAPTIALEIQLALIGLGILTGIVLNGKISKKFLESLDNGWGSVLPRFFKTSPVIPALKNVGAKYSFALKSLARPVFIKAGNYLLAMSLAAVSLTRILDVFGHHVLTDSGRILIVFALFAAGIMMFVSKKACHACGHEESSKIIGEKLSELGDIVFWIMLIQFLALILFSHYAIPHVNGLIGVFLGVSIALIPGCGPQIAVMTLWLNGIVPLEMFIANMIAQDGDGTLYLLSVSPKNASKLMVLRAIIGFATGLIFLILRSLLLVH